MKNVFLFAVLLLSFNVFCQSDVSASKEEKVFTVVEQMPMFPGGEEAMMKFIQKNIRYPKFEMDNNIEGRVIVGLIVNEDGSLSDISIRKSASKGIDKEALRVVKMMPDFQPGKQQGKAVKVSYMLPIKFKLSDPAPAKK